MDLYLDSVDFKEIEAALDFGFVKGLTTTPTFMHRHGITDIDGAIVKLSGMVPELQVEALGNNPKEILAEAERLLGLPARARARVQGAHQQRRREGVQAARRQGPSRQRASDLHAEPGVHGDGGRRVVHLSARGPDAGPGPRRDPAVRADRRRDRPLRLREQGDVLLRASCGARAPGDAHGRARLHDAVRRDEEPLREHAHGRGHGAVPRAHARS